MKIGRKLAVPAVGILLAGSGFGFLASNNVSTSYAGQGQGTIAGYNVSNVQYTTSDGVTTKDLHGNSLSADNGSTYIDSITFNLDHPATPANVRAVVQLNGSNFTYNDCVSTDGPADNAFSCTENLMSPNADNSSSPAPITSYWNGGAEITDHLTVIAAS